MASPQDARPMMDMNTTPLIDVMLVLLIMFIITIPVATHSVDVDLPVACRDCPIGDQVKNKIVIDADDTVRWNGEAVNEEQLAILLNASTRLPVEPELQFEPSANAGYAVSARTLNLIERSGVTKFGFVGNERYREFGNGR